MYLLLWGAPRLKGRQHAVLIARKSRQRWLQLTDSDIAVTVLVKAQCFANEFQFGGCLAGRRL